MHSEGVGRHWIDFLNNGNINGGISFSIVQNQRVIKRQDLGTFSASLILHANDYIWSLGVLLLGLCGAVVGISALSGSTTLATAL